MAACAWNLRKWLIATAIFLFWQKVGLCMDNTLQKHYQRLPSQWYWLVVLKDLCSLIEKTTLHLKSDFRLSRNLLKGQVGDEINVLMAACAWNLNTLQKHYQRLPSQWYWLDVLKDLCSLIEKTTLREIDLFG
jgi:adenosyl cobinamide kinase/adenosyl cobinamide phosphate guanylyltransferase